MHDQKSPQPEYTDKEPPSKHFSFRWIMRCIVAAIFVASGYIIWQDHPNQAPALPPPTSGIFYYSHDVWIGAEPPGTLAHAVFYPPGPTLILHPTNSGWSGYFHIAMAPSSVSVSGFLAILLPLTATVGRTHSPFISISVERDKSEKLIWVDVSIPRNTSDFTYDLPLSWTDPESSQHLGFGKTRYFLYIGNAYQRGSDIDSVTPFSSDLNRRNGSASEDTPAATVTVETTNPHEIFTNYTQPESLFSTPSDLQYAVNAEDTTPRPGLGLFRTISVTMENSDDAFYMQLDSNVFFVAIGFLLSEVAVFAEKKKKERRIAKST